MHTATFMMMLSRTERDMRQVEHYVDTPKWAIRIFLLIAAPVMAYKVRGLAEKLSEDVLRLADLTRMIDALPEEDQQIIDPDGKMAASLEYSLVKIRQIQGKGHKMLAMANGTKHTRMTEAMRQFMAVCAEQYEAIAGLAWSIGENDASCAPRTPGFRATTPEDVSAMLDRIAAGQ